MISIHSLPIGNGDCFIITFQSDQPEKQTQLLVIDSGFAGTYSTLKRELFRKIQKYDCEMRMLLTHIDQDHIGGYKALFQNSCFQEYSRIKTFYYNTTQSILKLCPGLDPDVIEDDDHISLGVETGYRDAITLETLLESKDVSVLTGLESGRKLSFGPGIQAICLSPSRSSLEKYRNWVKGQDGLTTACVPDYGKPLEELMDKPFIPDQSPTNASSISVLLEGYGHRLLFLGDSQPDDIVDSLRANGYSEDKPLEVDVTKLSHHGSKYNTSPELLHLLRCKYFLISGKGTLGHPDKETLARIIQAQPAPVFCFNFDITGKIFSPSEMEKFHIQAEYRTELVLL